MFYAHSEHTYVCVYVCTCVSGCVGEYTQAMYPGKGASIRVAKWACNYSTLKQYGQDYENGNALKIYVSMQIRKDEI